MMTEKLRVSGPRLENLADGADLVARPPFSTTFFFKLVFHVVGRVSRSL